MVNLKVQNGLFLFNRDKRTTHNSILCKILKKYNIMI